MDYLGTRGICFICKNKEKKEDGKYHCISENGFTGCEINECIICCPGFREDKDKKIETLQALNRDLIDAIQDILVYLYYKPGSTHIQKSEALKKGRLVLCKIHGSNKKVIE